MSTVYEYVAYVAAMYEQKYEAEQSDLPDHLQLSDESARNPWQNMFMQDFVLVAEFCEQEGPRPLFTVPEDAGEMFDKNAFAVHIMSVDYQTQTNHSFTLVNDTQLVFSEDRQNIFAYVHHFTLYDIEARGFVRPFCMCYISNSKKKILYNLEHFIEEFSKISKHFKSVNQHIFFDDLKQRLADLTYVKGCLEGFESEHSEWIEFPKNSSKNFHGLNKETVDCMLVETNKAIGIIETCGLIANGERNGCEKQIESEINNDRVETTHSTEPHECTVNIPNGDTEHLPVQALDTSATETEDAPNCHPSNEGQSHDEIIERLLRERKRHLLKFRNLHALCAFRAAEGIVYLKKLRQHFYQRFETFSIIKEETPLLDPFSSVFTIGGSFVMNFQKNINVSSTEPSSCVTGTTVNRSISYESAQSALSAESFESCLDENGLSQEVFQNEGERIVYTPFRHVTSGDLLGGDDLPSVLSSAVELNETTTSSNFTMSSSGHSRLSLDSLQDENDEDSSRSLSTALYFEHLQPTPIVNGFGRRSHRFSTGDLSSSTSTSSRPFQRQLSAVEMQSEFMRASSSSASSIGVPSALIRSNTLPTGVPYFCTDIKRFQGGSTPLYTGTYKDMFPSNETISSIDGTEDGIYVQCYAQQLSRRKANGPGGGIVRVLRRYGYLVHLLYALLRGRTVVVLADPSHQRDVHSLITSLWLFVPGHFRGSQQVVLWRKKPLRLTDLARFKLIGLSKSKQFNVLPNSVETHVTVLDYESGYLKTPPYQGEYLNQMLASRRWWKNDALFLAYIHSIFLEMSLKAYVCYFATSMKSSDQDAALAWKQRLLIPRDISIEYMTDILDALGILGSDVDIILYFLDLLTQQQLTDLSSGPQISDNISLDSISFSSLTSSDNFGFSHHGTKTRPIVLDFARRVTYKKSSE